jgi:Mg-chelatase subunit ChlD
MTKKKEQPVEIICVIDRSGSMQSTLNDAIGGFNSFIEEQTKLSKTTLFSAMFFNAPVEKKLFYDGVKISAVVPLDTRSYIPGGMTALFDAIGTTIGIVEDRHSKMKNPPRVLLMILTDGEENSSNEYTSKQIKEKIDELQNKKNWKVVYIGASADRFTQEKMAKTANNLNVPYFAAAGLNRAYCSMQSVSSEFVKGDDKDNKK